MSKSGKKENRKMSIYRRFKRLTTWNKLGAIGSLFAIPALFLGIYQVLRTDNIPIEVVTYGGIDIPIATKTNFRKELDEIYLSNEEKRLKAELHYREAVESLYKQEYSKAEKHFLRSIEYQKTASAYLKLTIVMMLQNRFSDAKNYVEAGLKIAEKIKRNELIAAFKQNLALCILTSNEPDFKKVLELSNDAITAAKIYGESKYLKEVRSRSHVTIFSTYSEQGLPEKAIEYFNKIKLEDTSILDRGNLINNLALAYYDIGQTEKSIQLLEDALKIGSEHNLPTIRANALNNLGIIISENKSEKNYLDIAVSKAKESYEISVKSKYIFGIANSALKLGEYYTHQKNYRSAEIYYNLSIPKLKEMKNYRSLSMVYFNIGGLYSERLYNEVFFGDISRSESSAEKLEKSKAKAIYFYKKAIKSYNKVLSLEEKHNFTNRKNSYLSLVLMAQISKCMRMKKEEKEYLNRSTKLYPDSTFDTKQ